MGKAMAFSGVRVPMVPCSSHTHGEDPGPCPLTRRSYGPINLEMPSTPLQGFSWTTGVLFCLIILWMLISSFTMYIFAKYMKRDFDEHPFDSDTPGTGFFLIAFC